MSPDSKMTDHFRITADQLSGESDLTLTGRKNPYAIKQGTVTFPTIPGFTILRLIDSGGMGQVYEATNQLGVHVAIKLIRPDKLSDHFLARFRQEAKSLMELKHPNIIQVYHYDVIHGSPFLVMQLIRGSTLAKEIDRFIGNPQRILKLYLRLVDAVAYLHRNGKIHRDLKPSNILVDESGNPYVADFGLIKDLGHNDREFDTDLGSTSENGSSEARKKIHSESATKETPKNLRGLTKAGIQIGTRPYMSPEQLDAEHHRIGTASDVWALGIILFELLEGTRPFAGEKSTELENQIRDSELPPLDPKRKVHSRAFQPVIHRCLAKKIEDRYPTAVELQRDIENIARQFSIGWFQKRSFKLSLLFSVISIILLGFWLIPAGETLRGEFQRKSSVDMLKRFDTDLPRWVGREAEFIRNDDGTYDLSTRQISLIPLGNSLTTDQEGYRLRVRFNFLSGHQLWVFVGHSKFIRETSERHCCFLACFNALNTRITNVTLNVGAFRNGNHLATYLLPPEKMANVIGFDEDGSIFIEWVVLPHRIEVNINNRIKHRVTRNRLMKTVPDYGIARPEFDDLTPTFAPKDGFGFLLRESRIRIKEISLERIPQ